MAKNRKLPLDRREGFHKSFKQKSAEIRKGIYTFAITDVICGQFETIRDVGIIFRCNKRFQRFRTTFVGFDLDGDKIVCRTNKEIFFERSVILFIIIKFIPRFNQRFAYDILVNRAFIYAEIFIRAQVFLRLLIQKRDKQPRIAEI